MDDLWSGYCSLGNMWAFSLFTLHFSYTDFTRHPMLKCATKSLKKKKLIFNEIIMIEKRITL